MLLEVAPPKSLSAVGVAIEQLIDTILGVMSTAPTYTDAVTQLEAHGEAYTRFLDARNSSVRAALQTLFANSTPLERQTGLMSRKNDLSFHKKDANFHFSHHNGVSWQAQVTEFLVHIYEQFFLNRGFRSLHTLPNVTGMPDLKQEPFGWLWYVKQVKAANALLECCPYCGCKMAWGTLLAEHARAQSEKGLVRPSCTLDHVFPKRKYPSLAISLWNLVPVCRECNSNFKGENDPLENSLHQGAVRLVCLPYKGEPSFGVGLKLKFGRDSETRYEVQDLGPASPITDKDQQAQIHNFVRVVQLKRQWSSRLLSLRTEAVSKLVKDALPTGMLPDKRKARRRLSKDAVGMRCVLAQHDNACLKYYFWYWLATNDTEWNALWTDVKRQFKKSKVNGLALIPPEVC